jgi:hypothetical protein
LASAASSSFCSFASSTSKSPSASWASAVWLCSVLLPYSRRLSSAFSCASSVIVSLSEATVTAVSAFTPTSSLCSAAMTFAVASADIVVRRGSDGVLVTNSPIRDGDLAAQAQSAGSINEVFGEPRGA